jgi:ribonuclease E
MCALQELELAAATPPPSNNAALLLSLDLEAIANQMEELSMGSTAQPQAAVQPMLPAIEHHQADAAPQIEAADNDQQQVVANNDQQQVVANNNQQQVVAENNQQQAGQVAGKRRRLAKVKGAAPTRRSLRIAGVAVPDLAVIAVPDDPVVPNELPAALAAPIVIPVVAPPPALAPAVAVLPEVAPAVAQVAPVLAEFAPDDPMGEDEDHAPMLIDEQRAEEAPPTVQTTPLTRFQMRKLAATGGWQAFMAPLPTEDWSEVEEQRGERRAAFKVCRAKNRYLAVALKPNLAL